MTEETKIVLIIIFASVSLIVSVLTIIAIYLDIKK